MDFFPPIVDDPYLYGMVAAANSMSDVYAMGGRVLLALNVAGFPRDFPREAMARIFQGGADKVAEAGGVVAGGHTVMDKEPKYGLAVTGLVHPDRIMIKGGLDPGHRLFLSKPLGTGVIITAAKGGSAQAAHLDAAIESMVRLNRGAAEAISELGIRGCTDVTGFGFLGHASEMVLASRCGIRVQAAAVPLFPGALPYAEQGLFAGGLGRNRKYLTGLAERGGAGPADRPIRAGGLGRAALRLGDLGRPTLLRPGGIRRRGLQPLCRQGRGRLGDRRGDPRPGHRGCVTARGDSTIGRSRIEEGERA